MSVLKNTCIFVAILSATLICPFAAAQESQPGGTTAITIYSTAAPGAMPPELYRPTQENGGYNLQPIPGYAMIRQERPMEIGKKRDAIRFADVAALIDPTTVTFSSLTDPAGTHVLEQNFQFASTSASQREV